MIVPTEPAVTSQFGKVATPVAKPSDQGVGEILDVVTEMALVPDIVL